MLLLGCTVTTGTTAGKEHHAGSPVTDMYLHSRTVSLLRWLLHRPCGFSFSCKAKLSNSMASAQSPALLTAQPRHHCKS
jgi:hypothetical protein